MKFKRILFIGLLSLISFSRGWGETTTPSAKDLLRTENKPLFQHVLGNEKADCVIVAYTSLSCHVCAGFHKSCVEPLLAKYPNQLCFILRDYPTDSASLKASLLSWYKPEKSEVLREAFYQRQKEWLELPDPTEELKKIAQENGLTKEETDACLKDETHLHDLIKFRQDEKKLTQLTAVPLIFMVSLKQGAQGEASVERLQDADFKTLDAAITKHLKPSNVLP